MNKSKRNIFFLALLFIFSLFQVSPNANTNLYYSETLEIEIDIAPNTLNIQSNGKVVTVHTNVKYSNVIHQDVYLNGIKISSWKSDNRGYFVAKFLMNEVKALSTTGDLVVPGENILTLVGYTIDGIEFTGSASINVIDNSSLKK